MRGAGSYWAERIQFTKDQYTEITKKQGHRTLFFCLFLGGVSSELVLHLDWYYGGDGSIFLQVSGYSGFITLEIIIDYMWYTCIYFYTLYKLHRHVCAHT
jgi:hypothetical protein